MTLAGGELLQPLCAESVETRSVPKHGGDWAVHLPSKNIVIMMFCFCALVVTPILYARQSIPSHWESLAAEASNGVVRTACGSYHGVPVSSKGDLYAWRGIKYGIAARWQPPLPAACESSAQHDASECGPHCFQPTSDLGFLGTEQCLQLHVFATERVVRDARKVPVLFFANNACGIAGTGCDSPYYGTYAVAASGDAISVTVNYRLNVLGWLYMEDDDGNPVGSSNNALRDLLLALIWTREHIAAFGGDPSAVTIYGQSSGGTAVISLLASPKATGLFARAYSASGSARIPYTKKNASEAWRRNILPNIHCGSKLLRQCLLELPPDVLFNAAGGADVLSPSFVFLAPTWKDEHEFGSAVIPFNVIDEDIIVSDPSTNSKDSRLPAVDLIVGVMREEVDFVWPLGTSDIIWPFTEEAVLKWGTNLTRDSSFAKSAWVLYRPTDGVTPRQRYAQLVTDARVTCQNFALARHYASLHPSRKVYAYLFTHHPTQEVTYNYCDYPGLQGLLPKYAFHTYDVIVMLFNATGGYNSPGIGAIDTPTVPFVARDFAVADRFRAGILQFASNGTIEGWSDLVTTNSICTVGTLGIQCSPMVKASECELWQHFNLSYKSSLVN